MKNIPNLFIAGLPRSGTSSLHHYLGQHPDIFMSRIKEPNFFARDFHKESDAFHKKQLYFPYRKKSQYLRLYKDWKTEKVAGEASWTNLYSKVSAKGIYEFNPQAKIIISIREPVSFLYSYHSAAAFALGENRLDFKEALNAEKTRREGKNLGKRVIVPSWLFYTDFIKLTEHIGRFFSMFDENQIMIIIHDDFRDHTVQMYQKILEFLNVDPEFVPEFNVVNSNKILKWPRLKKMILDSPYFRNTLRYFISDNAYAWLKNFYKDRVVTYKTRPPLDEEIKRELMKNFKTEVEKLNRLINIDLPVRWGYDKI